MPVSGLKGNVIKEAAAFYCPYVPLGVEMIPPIMQFDDVFFGFRMLQFNAMLSDESIIHSEAREAFDWAIENCPSVDFTDLRYASLGSSMKKYWTCKMSTMDAVAFKLRWCDSLI